MQRNMASLSDSPGRTFAQSSLNWSVIVALFALEGSCGLALLALYKKGEQGFSAFIQTNAGVSFFLSLAIFAISAGWIGRTYFLSYRNALRAFQLTVVMNLVTVFSVLVCSELVIRVLVKQTPQGDTINGLLLLPKNWDRLRDHYLAIWEKASTDQQQGLASDVSYWVYDRDLGWSIGPSRRSANGLYFSDSQGLRAPQTGNSFSLSQAASWIAVLGDSFTFGEEVTYEDTWAARLEKLLGGSFAVANFGVAGYGVDQAYLRYLRDVRPWHPAIAVLGFISDDLYRSTMVYPFLNYPEWENPFSKPRLLATEEELRLLNIPTIPPDMIFAQSSIADLPHLQHDKGYTPFEWQREWYHSSYFARFLLTRFPRWMPINANASEEAVFSLNERILRSFIHQASQSGTIPVIVYFPTSGDFRPRRPNLTGKRFLQRTGIPYVDPSSCLLQVPEAERFEPGEHYSPRANAAVAECLAQHLRHILPSLERSQ
ncbi:MAG TPA: SGNH/GDSL hydrolase family protein [Nitrospiraceae bacterium]|nr:SGNH/GDSL hydrolase family protein [Nitrospiraceae bacterium]